MNGNIRRQFRLFASGTYAEGDRRYELLYRAYWNYSGEEDDLVSLVRIENHPKRKCPERVRSGTCTCRVSWVVVKSTSTRSGIVCWSNRIREGTKVRTKAPWYFMKKRVGPDTLDTVGSPAMLTITATPRAGRRISLRRVA